MTRKVSLLFVVAIAACAEPLPEPPDLTDTIEAYERGPTVDVPIADVADLVLEWLDRLGLSEELIGSGFVLDVVRMGVGFPESDRPDLDPSDNPREALEILEGRFLVDLLVEATHICEGHDPKATAPDRERNGTLEVNLRLTESGFDGAFWGEFNTCRFWSDEVDLGFDFNTVIVDGPAALLFLDPAGFDIERDYIFVFDGLAIFNGVLLLDGQFDFLFLQGVGTEVRVSDREGGQIFFFVSVDDPNVVELRTLSETWQCDISLQRCLSSDGTQVSW